VQWPLLFTKNKKSTGSHRNTTTRRGFYLLFRLELSFNRERDVLFCNYRPTRKTLSLALREVHRLRVFENRVLRRIFGPKRDK
jgi:hypothetical protein